jgi:transposase InsO family protein
VNLDPRPVPKESDGTTTDQARRGQAARRAGGAARRGLDQGGGPPAVEAFSSLLEARVLVEDWRIEYNTVRPHSALGYLTPTDYAKAWTTTHPALS